MEDFFKDLFDDIKSDFKFGWKSLTSVVSLTTNAIKSKKDIKSIQDDVSILKDVVETSSNSAQDKISIAKKEIEELKK